MTIEEQLAKAERERDEANARVLDAALIHAELVRERDEARASVDCARASLDDCLICNKNLFGIIDECKRERDEALARCETLRELADVAALEQGLAQRRMMEAQRERDEARLDLAGLPAWQHACEQSRRDLAHAEAEVDRLRKDIDSAYRRGAEAMREACASRADGFSSGATASDMLDLTIPEEP